MKSIPRTVRLALCLMLLGSGSCPMPTATPLRQEPNYSTVRVFYATDRAAAKPTPRLDYGDTRGDGSLKLGYCDVSIPRDHQVARIERPSLLKFEFREDPKKHVVLLDVRQQSYADFYRDVAARSSELGDGTVLLFVHGFNVTFEAAAHRTAQLAYDLGINGAPVMYSWPAPSLYTEAENNADWTWRHLLGHSYFGDQRTLIADIFALISNDTPPRQRFGMVATAQGALEYFRFLP